MAGYSYVGQVKDPNAQKALRAAIDLITDLETRLANLEAVALTRGTVVVASGQRITQVGSPQAETDAATVGWTRQLVQALTESRVGGFSGVVDTGTTPLVSVANGLVTGAE